MKKKILSIVLALALIFTLLPQDSYALENPVASLLGTENTGDSDADSEDNAGNGNETDTEEDTDGEEGLLRYDAISHFHPTHLSEGSVSISDAINRTPSPGLLSFVKGKEKTTGKVKVKSWAVDSSGKVTFTLSNAKDGDTITLPVIIHSERYGSGTVTVVVTVGYRKLTITSATTVTYGATLKLTCAGQEKDSTVIYTIVDGKDYASIKDNILTPLKVGTVTVKAVATPATDDDCYSDVITITIEKATPTCRPGYTDLTRAGLTLADAELSLRTSSVKGTLEWVLPEDTVVISNVSYEWIFTPEDSENYESITGSIVPYAVDDDDFAIGEGDTVLNKDGSYTTTSYGEDDSRYELTEYPNGTKRMVHRQLDGTIVTTILDEDGTRTKTTKNPDGSTQVTATLSNRITYSTTEDRYGRMSVQVSLPHALTLNAEKKGTVIDLPIPELPGTDNRADAPTIVFSITSKHTVRVSIPINNPNAGTVAITVAKNGQESIVKSSTTGKDCVYVTLTGSTTVKIVDTSKNFNDVTRNDWFHGAADFVTSRGLFQGMDPVTFAPNATMSRAMIVTVLHNLEDNPDYGDFSYFKDARDTWYASAATWATYNGYINGYPDGTFHGDESITREQLAVILYRYAGYPDADDINTPIYDYYDYDSTSPYAWEAMYWAVNSGVLYTNGGNHLAPQRYATRAEVAQTFQNLVEYLYR